jgi:hypothetical protein
MLHYKDGGMAVDWEIQKKPISYMSKKDFCAKYASGCSLGAFPLCSFKDFH